MNKLIRFALLLMIVISSGIITGTSAYAIPIQKPSSESIGAGQTEAPKNLMMLDPSIRLDVKRNAHNFLWIQSDGTPPELTGEPVLIPADSWVPVSGDLIMFEIPVSIRFGSGINAESTPTVLFYDE